MSGPLYLPRPAEAKRQREKAIEWLRDLDDKTIDELLRRAQLSAIPDGYSPSTGAGAGRGASTNTPTEGGMFARTGFGRTPDDEERGIHEPDDPEAGYHPDPVRKAADRIFRTLAETWAALRQLDRDRRYVLSVGDAAGRGVDVLARGGICQACGREVAGTEADRLRAGLCDTDYRAWLREGRPDKAIWCVRRAMERQRAEEGCDSWVPDAGGAPVRCEREAGHSGSHVGPDTQGDLRSWSEAE